MGEHTPVNVRTLAPGRTALFDQVLAIVRDASPLPIGTHEIGKALGPYRPRWFAKTCRLPGCQHGHEEEAWYVRDYHPADVFRPLLLRGVRQGVIERIPKTVGKRLDAHGQNYWRWLGPPASDEVER